MSTHSLRNFGTWFDSTPKDVPEKISFAIKEDQNCTIFRNNFLGHLLQIISWKDNMSLMNQLWSIKIIVNL